MRVLGIGNALTDVLARIDSDSMLERLGLPKGSMQLIDTEKYIELRKELDGWELKKATGGSAANTIMALSNLGIDTGFIGRVGDDENGDFFADNCSRNNIDFKRVGDEGVSGVALTFISPDGQRTFGTHLGVAAQLHADALEHNMFEGFGFFHAEGYLTQDHELIDRAFSMAHAAGLKTSIDLASYNIVEADRNFFHYLLGKADVVFANEEEAMAFSGKEPEEALEDLAALCETAVVKVGERGALMARGEERVTVPARSVVPVDTTGAGDYFAAGFIYGLVHGHSLRASAEIGTLLASEVLQVIGTTLSSDVWEKIRAEVTELEKL
ncbi:MAG: adenosine kinase [Bacteroidaceae bacterium]|nr:adenosine kinase [Bacteroidaceae bacterium]